MIASRPKQHLRTVVQGSYFIGFLRFLTAIAQLIYARIAIGYLGVGDYAVFLTIYSFSNWISLADLGFGTSIQNKYSKNNSMGFSSICVLRDLSNIQVGLCSGLFLPVVLLAVGAGSMILYRLTALDVELYMAIICGVLAWLVAYVFGSTNKILYAMHKPLWANLPALFAAIASSLLIFLAARTLGDHHNKILICVLCSSLPLAGSAIVSSRVFLPRPQLDLNNFIKKVSASAKPYSRDARTFGVFAAMACLCTNLDYLIMPLNLTSLEISQYSVITKVMGVCYFFVYAKMLQMWPIFAEKIQLLDIKYVNNQINKIIKESCFLLVLACIAVIALSGQISFLLTKGEVDVEAIPVALCTLYYLVRVVVDIYAVALCSVNRSRNITLCMPIQAIMSGFLQYFLSRQFGLTGLLIGLTVAFACTSLWINPFLYETQVCSPARLRILRKNIIEKA